MGVLIDIGKYVVAYPDIVETAHEIVAICNQFNDKTIERLDFLVVVLLFFVEFIKIDSPWGLNNLHDALNFLCRPEPH